jgi:hypothetical protein
MDMEHPLDNITCLQIGWIVYYPNSIVKGLDLDGQIDRKGCVPYRRGHADARSSIKGFELMGADSKISTLNKLRRALEGAGVEFLDPDDGKGEGVRFKSMRGKR